MNLHEDLSKMVQTAEAHRAEPTMTRAVPWDTQPYSIKRDGINIINCDDEPVSTPGCIQAQGALLVLRPSDLAILQASENTQTILGQSAQQLLGQSVAAVVKVEGEARLRSILSTEPTDRNPIYAFTLPAGKQVAAMDVTLHTLDGVVMLEFEATGRGDPGKGTGPVAPGPPQPVASNSSITTPSRVCSVTSIAATCSPAGSVKA